MRTLVLHNEFNSTLVIHSVTLPDEAKPYFKVNKPLIRIVSDRDTALRTQVVLASEPVILPQNSKEAALKITFTPSSQLSHLETAFRLNTNLSHFDIDLQAYSGKLDLV